MDTAYETIPLTPTIDDVAKLAEVSTATVSRCLNNPEKLSKATRDKVLNAVEVLGYTPNFGGQVLASKRTNTMGAIIPTMENAIFARGLQAFQERLAQDNRTLLVASSNYDETIELEQVRSLIARGADGLLLIGSARLEKTYEYLERRKIPYVMAWNIDEQDHKTHIGFDNISAMSEMVDHVIQLGHQKLGMISGISAMNDRAQDRIKGAKQAIETHGIKSFPIVECDYSIESSGRAFETLLDQQQDITCVICGNDVLAVGAIMRAKEMGLKIPQDISITGFDDIEISTIIEPAITTVHVPHRQMGEIAAEALLQYHQSGKGPKSQKLTTKLIKRSSLQAPK